MIMISGSWSDNFNLDEHGISTATRVSHIIIPQNTSATRIPYSITHHGCTKDMSSSHRRLLRRTMPIQEAQQVCPCLQRAHNTVHSTTHGGAFPDGGEALRQLQVCAWIQWSHSRSSWIFGRLSHDPIATSYFGRTSAAQHHRLSARV